MMLAIVGKYGRLGNQLWTYSNALAFAMRHNFKIVCTDFDSHDLFNKNGLARQHELDGEYLRKLAKLAFRANLRLDAFPHIRLGESSLIDFDSDPDFVDCIHRKPLVFFSGLYFYAAESLIQHAKHIKEFFELVGPLAGRVSNLVERARAECDLLIGVHIRHGDYRTFCDGIMYYSPAEYAEIMHFLVDQFSGRKVGFLICSDENQKLQSFQGLSFFCEKNDAIIDLYALSQCDYLIGPNSTFSQWASFIGEVPLHTVRWKGRLRYEGQQPPHKSASELEFRPYSPREFGKFSQAKVRLRDVLKP